MKTRRGRLPGAVGGELEVAQRGRVERPADRRRLRIAAALAELVLELARLAGERPGVPGAHRRQPAADLVEPLPGGLELAAGRRPLTEGGDRPGGVGVGGEAGPAQVAGELVGELGAGGGVPLRLLAQLAAGGLIAGQLGVLGLELGVAAAGVLGRGHRGERLAGAAEQAVGGGELGRPPGRRDLDGDARRQPEAALAELGDARRRRLQLCPSRLDEQLLALPVGVEPAEVGEPYGRAAQPLLGEVEAGAALGELPPRRVRGAAGEALDEEADGDHQQGGAEDDPGGDAVPGGESADRGERPHRPGPALERAQPAPLRAGRGGGDEWGDGLEVARGDAGEPGARDLPAERGGAELGGAQLLGAPRHRALGGDLGAEGARLLPVLPLQGRHPAEGADRGGDLGAPPLGGADAVAGLVPAPLGGGGDLLDLAELATEGGDPLLALQREGGEAAPGLGDGLELGGLLLAARHRAPGGAEHRETARQPLPLALDPACGGRSRVRSRPVSRSISRAVASVRSRARARSPSTLRSRAVAAPRGLRERASVPTRSIAWRSRPSASAAVARLAEFASRWIASCRRSARCAAASGASGRRPSSPRQAVAQKTASSMPR